MRMRDEEIESDILCEEDIGLILLIFDFTFRARIGVCITRGSCKELLSTSLLGFSGLREYACFLNLHLFTSVARRDDVRHSACRG